MAAGGGRLSIRGSEHLSAQREEGAPDHSEEATCALSGSTPAGAFPR